MKNLHTPLSLKRCETSALLAALVAAQLLAGCAGTISVNISACNDGNTCTVDYCSAADGTCRHVGKDGCTACSNGSGASAQFCGFGVCLPQKPELTPCAGDNQCSGILRCLNTGVADVTLCLVNDLATGGARGRHRLRVLAALTAQIP